MGGSVEFSKFFKKGGSDFCYKMGGFNKIEGGGSLEKEGYHLISY